MKNSKGAASGISIEEAMKVLNMKNFNAQELNDKFRFRVQSVAQGLGGSLVVQKSIYTAWEYLNRMLARESSTHTEHLLRNADTTAQINEKPKRLDMIPFKLSNPTRKVSLIIEKKDKTRKVGTLKFERHMKSILKGNDQQLTRTLPPIQSSMKPLENAKALSNDPGHKSIKHVRWNENMNITYSDNNSNKTQSKKRSKRKLNLSAPSGKRTFVEKENTAVQLKEVIGFCEATNVEDDSTAEGKGTSRTLGKLMDELPKLLNLHTIPFKRVQALNEIYANPKRLSKHDQRAAALRMLWREESDQILQDALPDKAKRKTAHIGGKTRTNIGKLLRKSLQKQEEVLYRKFEHETFPKLSTVSNGQTRGLSQENRTLNLYADINQASMGLYTPSRINNWMKSSEQLNPE